MNLVRLRHWKMAPKIGGFVVVVVLTFVAVLFAWVLPTVRARVYTQKREAVQKAVETAYSLVAYYGSLAEKGRLSDADAQAEALHAVKALRFEGTNYFWVNDSHPTMVMHAMKPELDGKDLTNNKDPNGVQLFVEMARICRKDGEGFVEYSWAKPGKTAPQPKVSFVKRFAKWDWIVGAGAYVDDIEAAVSEARNTILPVYVAVGVLVLLIGVGFGRSIARSVNAAKDAAVRLAAGDVGQHLQVDREDEIGTLMQSVRTLQETLRERAAAADQIARGDLRVSVTVNSEADTLGQAMTRMRDNLVELVREIQGLVGVGNGHSDRDAANLAESSTRLTSISQHLAATAEETAVQASAVSSAAEGVSGNLGALESNSAQMLDSIEEIARAATAAARRAKDAVSVAETTHQTVLQLGESSAQIGSVAKLIATIATQTDVLALNAMIEAARAGHSGRGFAIVANEVKDLAKQTARSAEEIAQTIAVIQQQVAASVQAITQVSVVIREINGTSDTIAAAVEEQTATSNETARNAADAARGSALIAQNVAGLADAARESARGASDTQGTAAGLSEVASELRELVSRFAV